MDGDIKEEPPIEIEGYMLIDATAGQNFDFSDDEQESPKKKRKRSKKSEKIASFNANDEMQQLLQKWGLDVLCERFSTNLIDMSVLDYIVDVDIVDLCRDLPIRYRLILRHKLAEKRGKRWQNLDSYEQTEKTSVCRSMSAFEKARGEPLQIRSDNHFPKRAKCPIDMILDRPFAKRTEEEKSLLISMNIPRPHMPNLKSIYTRKGKATVNRKFYRTSYESAWWMCGSQKRNKLFCWPCLLLSPPTDPANSVWGKRGFDDLNHLSASIKSHSISQRHIDNADAYKNYGQPPATKDNERQSGNGSPNDTGGANTSKRKTIGKTKVSSNSKQPAPNMSAALENDLGYIEPILNQDMKLESIEPPELKL